MPRQVDIPLQLIIFFQSLFFSDLKPASFTSKRDIYLHIAKKSYIFILSYEDNIVQWKLSQVNDISNIYRFEPLSIPNFYFLKKIFCLISLFNCISTFVGYLIPKPMS